ncbi:hypothetical protein C8Q80DRAFT_1220560 [Daedaleopsis nitida]|nr:hypothetical protein C8Q80DRAFT_1220560 [Daedaleopsis nitida]
MCVRLSNFHCSRPSTSLCLSVNHLPLEIWQEIFILACIDGGYTGTSLALVSRFFHHASHPVRFRSLSLSSLCQIEHFLEYVQKHPRSTHDLTPKVTHLVLAFPHVPSDDSNGPDDDLGTGGPELWYSIRQARDQEKATWDKRFIILVPRLLDSVASHLESFTLIQSDGFVIPPIRHCLPHLRELTILMGISAMLNDDETATHAAETAPTTTPKPNSAPATSSLGHPAAPRASARFPALKRLHLVCGRHRDWTLRDPLAHLPTLAPALTHLRISNATYTHGQDGCVPDFLCAALGRGMLRPTPGPSARAVHMGTHRDPAAGGDYDGLVQAVRAMGVAWDGAEGADVRVKLIEGERMKHQVWVQLVRAQWLDRIGGGRGCWDEDDDLMLG